MSDENNVVEFPQQPQIEPLPPGPSDAELKAAGPEVTKAEQVTETATGTVTAPAGMSIEDQIKALEDKIDQLEAKRMKTVVEELEFDPVKLAVVAGDRAEERYKRAWQEMQKMVKQCAWSGLRSVTIDSVIPTINETIVHELIKHRFKAKVITVGGVQKIEVKW